MFPFWESVISPLIKAAGARRIVEIGALRGDTTSLLLDDLGADARLHVIDPLPRFDPAEHERRFPGRYVFHRDISHAILPDLEAVDVALVDGDHNWYTVHKELQLLAEAARREDEMLPLLIMHDVLWPYGRRDLYYAPERIPESERQPYREAGMHPAHSELMERGGINPKLANAVNEGGPRNGVMTALDDFVAEHDEPLRVIVLPIYFGLAIVASERRLEATPALAAEFERLGSTELKSELLELAEALRLRAVLSEHTAVYRDRERVSRLANRYLATIRAALLDEHQIENEVRLEYLAWCAVNRRDPDPAVLRDPAHHLQGKLDRLERARAAGTTPTDAVAVPFFPQTTIGHQGLEQLSAGLDAIRGEKVEGDLLECGTGRGGGAIYMRAYLEAHEMRRPTVWVADEFPSPDTPAAGPAQANQMADLNMVRRAFSRFGMLDDRVRFLQGPPEETLDVAPIGRLALVRIDAARTGGASGILERVYDKVATGGRLIVDGCDPREIEAIRALRERRGINEPLGVDGARVSWSKHAEAIGRTPAASPAVRHAPAPPPLPANSCDLSIVVVFHDMQREARRTLQSLSRGYQQGVEDLDYEVIAVENGSRESQRLGDELVTSFGPEFRYLDLGDASAASPAPALNQGIALARGRTIGVMIDGAHMLTPGVLRHAMQGLEEKAPAMVATQQWYLGPGQQVETIPEGYDSSYEDALLKRIEWPADGYRLFEIGHFIGARDWFDGMWESNCLFVERSTLEQVGGLDEGFAMPGGGYANLDLFERLGATPDLNLVTILGEGSFHQLHGGTTTNEPDRERRDGMLADYAGDYERKRGRGFRTLSKPFNYVGTMPDAARRTRPRRMTAKAFQDTAAELAPDRRPEQPMPMPEELQREFTDAYWRSMRWRGTSWMGRTVPRSPADLIAYQELIVQGRPDWVVEIGRDGGGRALFLASICELAGHGEVLSIDAAGEDLPDHPRITRLDGDPLEPVIAARAHEIAGDPGNALLVLGADRRDPLLAAFELYEDLVPVGSWVVLEDTILGGNPIWPGMGPGPAEAVGQIRRRHPEFEPDPSTARLAPTFNPNGYLKRTR